MRTENILIHLCIDEMLEPEGGPALMKGLSVDEQNATIDALIAELKRRRPANRREKDMSTERV